MGCCNFADVWGDKRANIQKMKSMMATAADLGCGIVVFPELALTGYECDPKGGRPCAMHAENAETIPGPATEELAAEASKHNLYAIFGLPEKDKSDPKAVYISAVVVGPQGLVGVYRKLNLAPPPVWAEQLCFTSGSRVMKEIPVFETRYGPIGVSICYDFWIFPEISRIQTAKGARVLINATASGAAPGGEPQPHMLHVTACRATENIAYAASANLAGKEVTKSFYGHSTIAGPAFPRLTHIYAHGGSGEEVVNATLSFDKLHKWRQMLPFFKDMRNFSAQVFLNEFQKQLSPK